MERMSDGTNERCGRGAGRLQQRLMCELSLEVHAKWARVGEGVTNPKRGAAERGGGTLDADGTESQLLVLGSRPGAQSDQM